MRAQPPRRAKRSHRDRRSHLRRPGARARHLSQRRSESRPFLPLRRTSLSPSARLRAGRGRPPHLHTSRKGDTGFGSTPDIQPLHSARRSSRQEWRYEGGDSLPSAQGRARICAKSTRRAVWRPLVLRLRCRAGPSNGEIRGSTGGGTVSRSRGSTAVVQSEDRCDAPSVDASARRALARHEGAP